MPATPPSTRSPHLSQQAKDFHDAQLRLATPGERAANVSRRLQLGAAVGDTATTGNRGYVNSNVRNSRLVNDLQGVTIATARWVKHLAWSRWRARVGCWPVEVLHSTGARGETRMSPRRISRVVLPHV